MTETENKLLQRIKKHCPRLYAVLIYNYIILEDLGLFLSTLTGYMPSHVIRMILYRRLFKIKVPSNSIIYWKCRFFKPSGIFIGNNSIIGNDGFLDGRKNVYIGNNVNIGAEVRVYTVEHDIESPDFGTSFGSVRINDWVYIGSRVTILPGVTIGEGAVIASGAVVTKNIDPWEMVGGIPAKFLKNRPIVKYQLDTSHRKYFQ